jgi:dipeptidyl aminopeptidase/acylaminoacyl peptidase
MKKTGQPILLPLALLLWGAAQAEERPVAKSSLDGLFDALSAVRTFKEVAISPDGRRVAWVETLTGKGHTSSPLSAIYVADLRASGQNYLNGGRKPPERSGTQGAYAPRSGFCPLALSSPDAAPRRISAGDGTVSHAEHCLAWSPDGSRLAFLSDKEKKGQLQLYLAPADRGPIRKITNVTGPSRGHAGPPRGIRSPSCSSKTPPGHSVRSRPPPPRSG